MKISKSDKQKGMIGTPYTRKRLRKDLDVGSTVVVQFHCNEKDKQPGDNFQLGVVLGKPANVHADDVHVVLVDGPGRRAYQHVFLDQILYYEAFHLPPAAVAALAEIREEVIETEDWKAAAQACKHK